MQNVNTKFAPNPTPGVFLCQTSCYGNEMKMCPSFALKFAFEEGASDNTRHISHDPELGLVVRVKFDNDDSMHIFSG